MPTRTPSTQIAKYVVDNMSEIGKTQDNRAPQAASMSPTQVREPQKFDSRGDVIS